MLIWMKQTLIWFNLQRDGTGDGFFNVKSAPKYAHLQSWPLKFICDSWAKCKEKVPSYCNVSEPNQNVETTYNSKLKFT